MKPSECMLEMREQIASNEMFTPSFALLSGIGQAHAGLTAMVRYLDEEQARRSAFESSVLARLAAVERKTSSEEYVEVLEDLGPLCVGGTQLHEFDETSFRHGRVMRVKWAKSDATRDPKGDT